MVLCDRIQTTVPMAPPIPLALWDVKPTVNLDSSIRYSRLV